MLKIFFYIVLCYCVRVCVCIQEAINLLEPMTNDPVNYVRQGALIASALIMIQQSEVTCPKVNVQSFNQEIGQKSSKSKCSFVSIGVKEIQSHNSQYVMGIVVLSIV